MPYSKKDKSHREDGYPPLTVIAAQYVSCFLNFRLGRLTLDYKEVSDTTSLLHPGRSCKQADGWAAFQATITSAGQLPDGLGSEFFQILGYSSPGIN